MKATFFAVGTLVAAVSAQSFGDLPACGQLCVNNMLADDKADELGCSADDVGCLCTNVDFTYGLRDCSLAVCSDEDAQLVLEYGQVICSAVGVVITTTAGSAIATRTGSGTAGPDSTDTSETTVETVLTTLTSPIATTTVNDEDGGIGGGLVTTFTSDGSQVVQTLTSEAGDILSSASDIASEIGSAVSSLASEASGVASDLSSRASGLVSSITNSAGDVVSTITEAAADPTESDGLAPRMTAAPIGMVAAAGLAAFLL